MKPKKANIFFKKYEFFYFSYKIHNSDAIFCHLCLLFSEIEAVDRRIARLGVNRLDVKNVEE